MIRHILALGFCAVLLSGCDVLSPSVQDTATDDHVFADAYNNQQSGLQVSGQGTVVRLLSDDNEGSRHQRFVVSLASGQTLLIAHNIDLAHRIDQLQVGDSMEFNGVYEWNDEGGTVHWTHRDPQGVHQGGWIIHGGTTYQ